jgi:hypothetical protein
MAPSMPERALREIIKRGVRVIDTQGRRLVQLEAKAMLAAARRRTNWHGFGDDAFREPLRRLLHSIDHEARLNFFGRVAAREDLTRMLCSRLKIERDREQHPDIAKEDIRSPVFITGLPRTGSTLLHGLLAQDPANRVPLHWEVMHPSPPPERATYEVDRRIDVAERQIGWFHRLAPGFRKIHPVSARLPQECTVLLSHSFLSFQFSTSFFVPSYQEWMEAQDLRPAYQIHRQFLQQLQWRCRGERWVLKAPPHLPGLTALSATYPDAVVIMTHRDPLWRRSRACTPSCAARSVMRWMPGALALKSAGCWPATFGAACRRVMPAACRPSASSTSGTPIWSTIRWQPCGGSTGSLTCR